MGDRAAVADLLPIRQSFTIQGKGFLKIAYLPRDMCHLALMPGDTELISHFPVEIQHEVCMFSSLGQIAPIECQPGQDALGSYGCIRIHGSLRQGKTFFHIGLQLFCSLWSMNFHRYICQSLQNIGEFLSISQFSADVFAFVQRVECQPLHHPENADENPKKLSACTNVNLSSNCRARATPCLAASLP